MSLEYYIILIIKIASCLGQQYAYRSDLASANLMCSAEKVQFSTTSVSAISCVKVCSLTQNCHAVIFYHGNKTCFGLNTDCPFNVTIPLPGAVFYKRKMPTTGCVNPFPMVAPVADSQLSASSEWSSIYAPHMARLTDSMFWGSQVVPVDGEYIQVDFLSLRVATAVTTQGVGDEVGFDHRVTSYTISTSIDCVSFCTILDIDGSEQIFPGNPDNTTLVTNNIEPPVSVRCLRINPRTWFDHICMRFEVMGCIP